MSGPAYYSGTINIAKNEDWVVALVYAAAYPNPNYPLVSGDPTEEFVVQPLDLTDSTISLQIRKNDFDKTAIVSITNDDGVEITDAAAGEFTLTISRAKLVRLHAGEYVADLIRTDPDGNRERLWEGDAIVVEGTTR